MPAFASSPSIAVGIATSGRAAILRATLQYIESQTVAPAAIYVAYGKPEDIAQLPAEFPAVSFMQKQGGLCDKRNLILDQAATHDIVLFLDDDFLLCRNYLQVLGAAFAQQPELAGATGTLLADGIHGPGMTIAEAEQILANAPAPDANGKPASYDVFNTYGCNMAFRLSLVREHQLQFDTQLPFYAWYEDIDFSRRAGRYGAIRKLRDARGIHLGNKGGRISGVRLGYSQVANPVYLNAKGTYPASHMLRSILRNICANLLRQFSPEPYVDRRGRVKGNLLAFLDIFRRRLHPTRIHEL